MIKLYEYRLRFKQAFRIAGYNRKFRKGLIVRYTGDGPDLAAEVAPLPGFSSESINDVLRVFASHYKDLNDFLRNVCNQEQIKHFFKQHDYPPSVHFGLSCLALDLISHRNGMADIPRPLSGHGSHISVNAVIGIGSKQEVSTSIMDLYKAGYRTIKLKCGPETSRLKEVITEAAESFPDLKFRLDANGSLPKKRALKILEGFSDLPIEYCEEPVPFRNLKEIAGFRASSPLPIALDESICNFRILREIVESHAADVIIIKPMILGNLIDFIETFTHEYTHIVDRVCTTSLESGVGRSSVAKAASIFGSSNVAHGLDTGRLFSEDIYAEHIERGSPKVVVPGFWSSGFSQCDTNKLSKIDL